MLSSPSGSISGFPVVLNRLGTPVQGDPLLLLEVKLMFELKVISYFIKLHMIG